MAPGLQVCLILCVVVWAHTIQSIDSRHSDRFPQSQAEQFIKNFNLVPRAADYREDGPGDDAKVMEYSLKLDIHGDPETDTTELGHHAGYFRLQGTHASRMFYMFFESRGSKLNDPVVLWMSGGPGCSSELALFYENGPFKISDELQLFWNDHGWDKVSNIIFVDQPIGTGFSYTKDVRDLRYDEHGVADDMYHFLQAFFDYHPELRNNDLYITGESYAGHYVPALTSRIHKANKANEGPLLNLKGFAIGNGLTDPKIQYKAYADYAVSMGLISEKVSKKLEKLYPACDTSVDLCGTSGTMTCVASYLVCNSIFNTIMALVGRVNEDVKTALGVGKRKFVSCSPLVYEMMIVDWMRNLEIDIPGLLEDGIKLLVYAGEYDLICNWLGNSRWVSDISWSGKQNYSSAPATPFIVDSEEAGIMTHFGPLTFLKVHDAGHMVPMDQPKASLEMIRWFTQQNSLEEESIKLIEQVV